MASAIIQNGVYFLILLLLTKPLGLFMYQVFNGERTFLHPILRPVERGIYRLTGVDEEREMRWTTYAVAMLLFNLVGLLAHLRGAAAAGRAAVQSAGSARGRGAPRVQHRRLVHDQHQLAELLPRDHDELSDRRWSGSPCTTSPRRRPASRSRSPWCVASPVTPQTRSATSGSTSSARTLYLLLPISLVVHAGARRAGRAADVQRLRRGDDDRRRRAAAPPGTGGQPDRDQAVRLERRRLLQRQLGPSLREPDAASPT